MKPIVKFIDHTPEYLSKQEMFNDHFIALMATNIEIKIKTSDLTPFKKGALRSSARTVHLGLGRYAVTAGTGSTSASYAAAQEAGTTRGYPMKNYTTSGTGAHWFETAIDTVKLNAEQLIDASMRAVGLRRV